MGALNTQIKQQRHHPSNTDTTPNACKQHSLSHGPILAHVLPSFDSSRDSSDIGKQ